MLGYGSVYVWYKYWTTSTNIQNLNIRSEPIHWPSFTMADLQSKCDPKGAAAAQDFDVADYITEEEQSTQIDDAYLRSSWFPRFYRGVLFQMILFGT